MIDRINQIKDFGSFKDYRWKATNDFNKINLFFGWNYSGKTTLSRIFSSYERNENQYENSHFSIKANDRNIDEKTLDQIPNVHVFNTDFINRNIRWNNSELDPFAIIGEETNELRTEIDRLEVQLEEEKTLFETTEKELNRVKKDKEEFETRVGRDIKNNLKIPDYNKRDLLEDLSKIADILQDQILSNDKYQSNMMIINNDDIKGKLIPITINSRNLNEDYRRIFELCNRTVSGERIQELIDNEELGKWIEEGLRLNEGHSLCRFCGSKINQNVVEKYHNHFSEEYRKLLSELTEEKKTLCKIDYPHYIEEQFYPEIKSDFLESEEKVKRLISDYNQKIDVLVEMIDKKIENLFESIICEPFDYTPDYSPIIEYNNIISRNSEKSDNYQRLKKDALIELKYHNIADNIINSDYELWKKELAEKQNIIKESQDKITRLEEEVYDLKIKISNTDKAASCINSILEDYFNKNDIKLVHEEGKFYLQRQGVRAKNLSEGEQTAIAFSYFLARLKESDMSEQIVFIDDPISSLDSNHLFLTYSMICDLFYIKTEGSKDKTLSCKQLFISTHNYEFFRFLVEEFRKGNTTSFYLIKRTNDGDCFSSTLEDLPKVFVDYDSEYTYLFSRMIDFSSNPSLEFDQLYDIPNIVRKVLDSYCQFRYQVKFSNSEKLLFDNTNEFKRVYKFVNHKSHTSTASLLQLPDLSECEEVVNLVISTIRNKDNIHYSSVLDKIKKANDGNNKQKGE